MDIDQHKAVIVALDLRGTHWEHLEDTDSEGLEEELRRETGPGHVLFEMPLVAVARSFAQDDVLYITADPEFPYTIVHLTWNRHPEPPPWPESVRHRGLEALLEDLI